MDKVEPITVQFFGEAEELATKSGRMTDRIEQRLAYIMSTIFELFNQKTAFWYFYGEGDSGSGGFWKHQYKDYISIVVDDCYSQLVIVAKNGSDWGLTGSIPARWLYEDFEEELTEGKKKWEVKETARKEAEKQKRIQDKEDAEALAKVAAGKLSKEELAALRSTLGVISFK